MESTDKSGDIRIATIENRILLIRGEKVIVDADLADYFGVPTRRLNEQVKRNKDRFPKDFMFQMAEEEKREVIAKCDHLANLKYSKALPYVFTEHGALMAASVLNTKRPYQRRGESDSVKKNHKFFHHRFGQPVPL